MSERFRGKSKGGLYGDVIECLDWSTGQILDALKEEGLDDNTLVIFTSDNGPWLVKGNDGGSALPLRAGKGTTYEGGVRVPCIARWPGRIPAGTVCPEMAANFDIYPTLAKLAGATVPEDRIIDGRDIWPLLSGQKPELDREPLLYFDDIHLQCARWKQWKLHVARYNSAAYSPAPAGGRVSLPLPAPELYDLVNDPDESYDIAPEHPEIVAETRNRIEKMMAGFPDQIRKAYEQSKSRKVAPTAVGNFPRAAG